jgi:peptide deformylase
LNILKLPHPALSTVCESLPFGEDIIATSTEMLNLMYNSSGIGLAAPQVGILKRFFVMKPGSLSWVIINPEIIGGRGEESWVEGCLSDPGFTKKVTRFSSIDILFWDENWDQHTKTVGGVFARVFQHELDHLNGKNIRYAI